ncbi:hypothetical protein D3C73_877180 [compost metagenome]
MTVHSAPVTLDIDYHIIPINGTYVCILFIILLKAAYDASFPTESSEEELLCYITKTVSYLRKKYIFQQMIEATILVMAFMRFFVFIKPSFTKRKLIWSD